MKKLLLSLIAFAAIKAGENLENSKVTRACPPCYNQCNTVNCPAPCPPCNSCCPECFTFGVFTVTEAGTLGTQLGTKYIVNITSTGIPGSFVATVILTSPACSLLIPVVKAISTITGDFPDQPTLVDTGANAAPSSNSFSFTVTPSTTYSFIVAPAT